SAVELLRIQRRWATRHIRPDAGGSEGERMIRIGYHCAFMNSDTVRFIMSAVIKRHDRRRFAVIGYSSTDVARDIDEAFDQLRLTTNLSDEQFAAQVRADRTDIPVEMTGFSPHHRYGAMALRCAPIQISYMNHLGTTAVPNVDYILADEVSLPPGDEPFFTE